MGMKTLISPIAKVKVHGDLLLLLPSSDTETMENLWVWNGRYLKSISPIPNINVSTCKVVELVIHGILIKPVNLNIVMNSKILSIEHLGEINLHDITLTTTLTHLCDSKVPISNLALLNGTPVGFVFHTQKYYI
jgi:hypothetical protein